MMGALEVTDWIGAKETEPVSQGGSRWALQPENLFVDGLSVDAHQKISIARFSVDANYLSHPDEKSRRKFCLSGFPSLRSVVGQSATEVEHYWWTRDFADGD